MVGPKKCHDDSPCTDIIELFGYNVLYTASESGSIQDVAGPKKCHDDGPCTDIIELFGYNVRYTASESGSVQDVVGS